MQYAEVILPLAVRYTYTFGVPLEMQTLLKVGCSVEVQFGAKKIYSGIVKRLHNDKPEAYTIKPIRNILEKEPVVTEAQLRFWEWLASYYACTEGEVMAAALPAHMKLVSDTYLVLPEDFNINNYDLTDDEYMVLQALEVRQQQMKNNEETT